MPPIVDMDMELEPAMIFRRRHARPDPVDPEQSRAPGALRPQDVLAMTGAALNMAEGSAAFLTAVRTLGEQQRRNRAWIWVLSVVVAALLVVSGTVAHLLLDQRDTNRQLQVTTAELRVTTVLVQAVQGRTSDQVLCPLFRIFVNSFTPASRARQPAGTLAAYDQAVVAIESAYAVLTCPSAPSRIRPRVHPD